ncbi:jg18503 [Pararge aegeria aegeria]|uniref:Jg18503 protein n=1 Tax=Pararge aegeria aegeria TaxID=348720 RepID=A0A8S4S138_9NEOP|nr:jg18503 [Pararge aegeria aegeria]
MQELLARIKICYQIICCVPIDIIFSRIKNPDTEQIAHCKEQIPSSEENIPCCKEQIPCGKEQIFHSKEQQDFNCNVNTRDKENESHLNQNVKIRIMEKSKTKTNIDNKSPIVNKSNRRIISAKIPKDQKKTDRCLETRISSIKLYSRVEKIRILKELQITDANIDKLISGKIEQRSAKEYQTHSIDIKDFAQPTNTKSVAQSIDEKYVEQSRDNKNMEKSLCNKFFGHTTSNKYFAKPISNASADQSVDEKSTDSLIGNRNTSKGLPAMNEAEDAQDTTNSTDNKSLTKCQCINNSELAKKAILNFAGDGPEIKISQIKIHVKRRKGGNFFRRLFKSQTNDNIPINDVNKNCDCIRK